MRHIRIFYSTVTPESAEIGEYADNGWINEEGVCIDPNEFDEPNDQDDFNNIVDLAVKTIRDDCGGVEASNYPTCCPGYTWYTQCDPDMGYEDSSEMRRSYHLDGFSVSEELAIYAELTRR